jgi:hypothetical protein
MKARESRPITCLLGRSVVLCLVFTFGCCASTITRSIHDGRVVLVAAAGAASRQHVRIGLEKLWQLA